MSAADVFQETPFPAASLSQDYLQFTRVRTPGSSSAESAWIGEIQPFASNECARAFLHDVENGKEVWLSGGRIREASSIGSHWADPLLVGMSVKCRLLVLVQPGPAHPRAYLLRPLYAEHYSYVHPHPRFDQQIEWRGAKISGLCIYSASEFEYDPDRERISQFLDQVTLYVARHLIWLRTRRLLRGVPPGGEVLRMLRPGEMLVDDRPVVVSPARGSQKAVWDYWSGYWPGPIAEAFNPKTHFRKIHPHKECWCGSGLIYESCHRPSDAAAAVRDC